MGEKSARGRMCDNCLHGHKGRCIVPWCPCICRQPVDHLDSPKVRMYFKERNRVDKIVPRMIVVEDNGEPKRILFKRFMELLEGKEAPMNGRSKGEDLLKLLTIPAHKENNMTTRSKRQSGFSLLELLIAMAIMLVIAAIAIPSYQAAQRRAKETAALEHAQLISKAVVHFEEEYGPNQTLTLAELGNSDSPTCAPVGGVSALACLIPTALAGGASGSYTFVLAQSAVPITTWSVLATPSDPNIPNIYCVDQTGIARYSVGAGVTGATTGCAGGLVVGS